MTRKRKRDIEDAINDLTDSDDGDDTVDLDVSVEWAEYDQNTDPDADVVARYHVVMRRERAEREGREILGPADGPGDLVRIARDGDGRANP